MSEFRASNGIRVWIDERGNIRTTLNRFPSLREDFAARTQALREFFQHERDEQLGRWRWPEHPEYVVWPVAPGSPAVLVLNEGAGPTITCRRDEWLPSGQGHLGAARAYFDAHPEPKPWHNAKPGEVWVVTTDKMIHGCAVVRGRGEKYNNLVMFKSEGIHIGVHDPRIVTASRIWPDAPIKED